MSAIFPPLPFASGQSSQKPRQQTSLRHLPRAASIQHAGYTPMLRLMPSHYSGLTARARVIALATELVLGTMVVSGIIFLQSQYKPLLLSHKSLDVRVLADAVKPDVAPKPPPPKLTEPIVIPPAIPIFTIAVPQTITQVIRAELPPPPEPKVVVAAGPSLDVLTAYQALLKNAVQQAIVYPSAAKAAGIKGNARVAFDFFNGHVSNVEVTQSSGSGVIDRAAIAAVSSANMPAPPAELQDKKFRFLIVVTFALTS